MPYVEGQTIHDADSHIMELPGTINRYLAPNFRDAFVEKTGRADVLPEWFAKAAAQTENPEFLAGAEANILLRKNYEALGAFKASDRPKTLDYLGFASQLVFTTACLSNFGLEQMGEVELAVEAARAQLTSGPQVDLAGASVAVSGQAPHGPASVWLVRYDPNTVQVPIRRGENTGRTLPHKNVVRELTRLGDWAGGQKTFAIPAGPAGLKTAILVQSGTGGPILAAAKG